MKWGVRSTRVVFIQDVNGERASIGSRKVRRGWVGKTRALADTGKSLPWLGKREASQTKRWVLHRIHKGGRDAQW